MADIPPPLGKVADQNAARSIPSHSNGSPPVPSPSLTERGAMNWHNWTIFGWVRAISAFLAGTVIVFVISVLAESNIRHFFEERGWDTFLTRAFPAMSEILSHHFAWLTIGLIFGSAAAVWLIWAFPHRLGDHDTMPKSTIAKLITAISAIALIVASFYVANTGIDLPKPDGSTDGSAPAVLPKSALLGLDDARRFQLVKTLHDATLNNQTGRMMCHAMAHQQPGTKWAVDFWSEFSVIMLTADWRVEGGRTPKTSFSPGITMSISKDTGEAFNCAFRLSEILSGLNVISNIHINQVTPDLIACEKENPKDGCIEFVMGDSL